MNQRPIWADQFPAARQEEQHVTRRQLLKFACLASLGAAFASVAGVLVHALPNPPAPRQAIALVQDIPVGGSQGFAYPAPSDPAILVRLAADQFVAYDRRCTHLRCPVLWSAAEGRLNCPCHAGAFAVADGQPLKGPPQRPLPRIHLEVVDGVVYATGREAGA